MCEIPTTAMPDPSAHSLSNLQAEGKMPGDGQMESVEGIIGKCIGGPHCSSKDFASCEQTQAQDNCQWVAAVEDGNKTKSSTITAPPTSTEQTAPIPAVSAMDQLICKPECRDEVFPGDSVVRSMCEQDCCKGCPQCKTLTTPAPIASRSVETLRADGRLPGDGQGKLTEGSASECIGGPDCSGKDFASCQLMQAQGMCTWARSVATTAPAIDGNAPPSEPDSLPITPATPSDTQSSAAVRLNTSMNMVIGIVVLVAVVIH